MCEGYQPGGPLKPLDWTYLETTVPEDRKQLVLSPSFIYVLTTGGNMIKLNRTSGEFINGVFVYGMTNIQVFPDESRILGHNTRLICIIDTANGAILTHRQRT